MATLTSQQLKDSYQSLVTIGDSITSDPTSGQLENGKGTALTAVGIGTNNPNAELAVVINDTTSTPTILIGNNDLSARSALLKNHNDASNFDIIASASLNADKGLRFFTDTATERMKITSGGDISFRDTSNNEAFYWDASAGSLGIGMTSPSNTTHIYKNASMGSPASFTSANAGLRIQDSSNSMYFDGNGIVADGSGPFEIGTTKSADVVLFTNAQERMRIDSSGNVGIGTGTTVDDKFHVIGTSTKIQELGQTGITMKFNHGNNASVNSDVNIANIKSFVSSGSTGSESGGITFETRLSGTTAERMRILPSGGITFNGDTATANALDDYEEGTFTPTLTYATPGTLSVTYDAGQTGGKYTKIGRQVTIELKLVLTAFTKGTASGNLLIGGLPFTSTSSTDSIAVGSFIGLNYTSGISADNLALTRTLVLSNDTHIRVLRMQADSTFTSDDPDTNSQFFVSATYFV